MRPPSPLRLRYMYLLRCTLHRRIAMQLLQLANIARSEVSARLVADILWQAEIANPLRLGPPVLVAYVDFANVRAQPASSTGNPGNQDRANSSDAQNGQYVDSVPSGASSTIRSQPTTYVSRWAVCGTWCLPRSSPNPLEILFTSSDPK